MLNNHTQTRRRLLKIIGVAAIGAISGTTLVKLTKDNRLHRVTWKGIALGSQAEITIYHSDKREAENILKDSYKKLSKLENLFSLYKNNSQLSLLNKNGFIEKPHPDMIELFNLSEKYAKITNGAFDITVQPLWNVYSKAFNDNGKPPSEIEIEKALSLVDWKSISIDNNLISFKKPGMSSTLNGIAQGFITDKISENLINLGIDNTLVQLGEYRGIGDHPDGRPWRLLLSNPENTDSIGEIEFTNAAVATSAGLGTPFDLTGNYHHIFDPKNGHNPNKQLQASVLSKTATEADALATAFLVLDQQDSENIAKKLKVGFEIFDNNRNRKIITSI
ncbi:MAG: thiamine biosynthesis protein ApbE [Pelagibacterales bacterium]|nr:thiamine biosynthesis protein ApbE [Pelagibacterales bacterium]PPR16252.1 MAG: FAD:protein FMN transferase [Alphaproteobacteria bacterium MarineAlpha9_Bin3]|tara:strand:+ start:2467 stop:3468 length:1002 start_codon:yes stop_codon:yes gene_type:complete